MTDGFDRSAILRRFEELLDAGMAGDPQPSGLPADLVAATLGESADSAPGECDSYSMWAVVTALTQEIKLQGRAFQDLNESVSGQAGKIAAELRAVHAERERSIQRDAEQRCRRELLGSLLDLRDRLSRGLDSARAIEEQNASQPPAAAGWLARMFAKPAPAPIKDDALSALLRGYELSLERLDQTLGDFNAREIQCAGEMFDPKRMNAIESGESDSHPPGTVMEVYRAGYEWNGEVFRTAQVKVARARARASEEVREQN